MALFWVQIADMINCIFLVSLRGFGYVEYPVTDVHKETQLSVEFVSRKSDGVIVVAEGTSDHVIVELKESRIIVTLSLRNRKFKINATEEQYSNGKWHNVNVERINSKLKLHVDGKLVEILKIKPQLSGTLEIDKAIFVGGIADFRKPSLSFSTVGHYFHGCIANATFNGHNVLEPPKNRLTSDRGSVEASGIGWGQCDEKVFSASPIAQSYVLPEAYSSYHKWGVRFGGHLTFEFRTVQPYGLLLFNGGRYRYPDYIGLELVNGRLRLGIDYGHNATVELFVGKKLNNWQWHTVDLVVSSIKVKIKVGKYSNYTKIFGRRGTLDVAGALFVGGIRREVRQEAIMKGMVSTRQTDGGSFSGCLRSLTLNNVEVNPREERNSRGVSLGCKNVSPCLLKPCKMGETCIERGGDTSYDCVCRYKNASCSQSRPEGSGQSLTSLENFPTLQTTSKSTQHSSITEYVHMTEKMKTTGTMLTSGIVQVTNVAIAEASVDTLFVETGDLNVQEGERIVLDGSSLHIAVSSRSDKWVREQANSIVLNQENEFLHGQLEQNNDVVQNFSYRSLLDRQIVYKHDGSETLYSILMFSITFLNQTKSFSLNITVNPINDDLVLVHPKGNVRLTVLSGTRSHITSSDLLVTDPDNHPSEIGFEVLSGRQTEGQLELVDQPNVPLSGFTQDQINNKKLVFHHTNVTDRSALVLTLRVTDGRDQLVFRFAIGIIVVNVTLRVSSLTVSQGASLVISSSSVEVTVDATEKQLFNVETQFQVVSEPHHGTLSIKGKRLRLGETFPLSAVRMGHISYIHRTDKFEATDQFRLQAWIGLSHSNIYTVRVSISLGLIRIYVSSVSVQEGQTTVIDQNHMNVTVDPLVTFPVDLIIEIVNQTKHGQLVMIRRNGRRQSANTLTAEDIRRGRLLYSHDNSETVKDFFTFRVQATSSLRDELEQERMMSLMRVNINIFPVNDQKPEIVRNKELQLLEGSSHTVTHKYLYIKDGDTSSENLTIFVNTADANGFWSLKTVQSKPISSFTQQDIDDNNLLFTHTRSQSLTWQCTFKVTDGNYVTSDNIFSVKAVPLTLDVMSPRGKPVVVDAKRSVNARITQSHLMAETNDKKQNKAVIFAMKVPPHYGYLANKLKPHRQIQLFSQSDVDDGLIKYFLNDKNTQATNDLVTFQVSIGASWTNFTLFVKIIPRPVPFVVVNKGLNVAENEEALITKNELKVSDLLNTVATQITYYVESGPSHGHLFTHSQPHLSILLFSQADVNRKRLNYFHTGGQASLDHVYLTVSNGRYNRSGIEFLIVIYSTQLNVTIRGLQLQEGSFKLITRDLIQIESFSNEPLVIRVSQGPSHGRLIASNNHSLTVHTVSVSQLEAGDVTYRHDHSESSTDGFVFNITDESGRLRFTGIFNISVVLVNDNPPRLLNVSPLNVYQYGCVAITENNLLFVDDDNENDNTMLKYQVVGGLSRETRLVKKGEWSKGISKFTQGDVSAGLIFYVHSGTKLKDKKSLFVSDGLHRDFVFLDINVQLVNIEVGNTGIVLFRGQKSTISSSNLTVTVNVNISALDIVYLVTSPPRHGRLLLSSNDTTEFTQQNVDNKELVFQHDGSNNREDKFSLTISFCTVTPVNFDFAIRIDQAPVVSTPSPFSVEEGGNATLTNNFLLVSDSEQGDDQIVLSVIRPPVAGQLVRVSSSGSFQPITSFTQRDINSSFIVYQHRGGSSSRDGLSLSVSDGHNVRSLNLFITIISLHIVFTSEPLIVKEGGSTQLSENQLLPTNVHLRNHNLKFVLVTAPTHGVLELMHKDGQTDMTSDGKNMFIFYTHDMSLGLVRYEHSGEEYFNDSFVVVGSEGMKKSDLVRINVSVIPVNDQRPVVVVNEQLKMWANDVTTITTNELSYSDGDTDSNGIVYSVTQKPTNGYLMLSTNISNEVNTFTQLDLEESRVLFQHEGDNAGGFRFEVSDGKTVIEDVFGIVATPLELKIDRLTGISALPGKVTPITWYNLSVVSNDINSTRTILFILKPSDLLRGVVVSTIPPHHPISVFTMADVMSGRVGYKHTDLFSWQPDDHFLFNVSMNFTEPLINQLFPIHILLKHTPGSRLASNNVLKILEGNIGLITSDLLDATNVAAEVAALNVNASTLLRIVYNVTVAPKHGMLVKTSAPGMEMMSFTQAEINTGQVKYKHNGSETVRDSFLFSLVIGDGIVSLVSEWFNISISPVDNKKFHIMRKKGLTIVRGMSQVVTRDELLTVDEDTSDAKIIYELVHQSMNIALQNSDYPDQTVTRFSQDDINKGRIEFIHDDTNILTASVILKISDGKHEPLVQPFPITISPLFVDVVNLSAVELEQGIFSVNISSHHLSVKSNGRIEYISYVVSLQPKFGYLSIRNQRQDNFTQVDLDNKQVSYTQENKSVPGDVFVVTVMYKQQKTINITLEVEVKPVIYVDQLQSYAGHFAVILLDVLNASYLAHVTDSNPLFTIVQPPLHGNISLKKVQGIRVFRHQDVIKGNIEYISTVNATDSNITVYDRVGFELSVDSHAQVLVQPARGVLPIAIHLTLPPTNMLTATSTDAMIVTSTPTTHSTTRQYVNRISQPSIVSTTLYNGTEDPTSSSGSDDSNLAVDPGAASSSGDGAATVAIPIIVILFVMIAVILGVIGFHKYRHQKQTNQTETPDSTSDGQTRNGHESTANGSRATGVSQSHNDINTDPGVESTDYDTDEEAHEDASTGQTNVKRSRHKRRAIVNEVKKDGAEVVNTEGETEWEGTEIVKAHPGDPKLHGNEYWV